MNTQRMENSITSFPYDPPRQIKSDQKSQINYLDRYVDGKQ